jgi:hypothetical protein
MTGETAAGEKRAEERTVEEKTAEGKSAGRRKSAGAGNPAGRAATAAVPGMKRKDATVPA